MTEPARLTRRRFAAGTGLGVAALVATAYAPLAVGREFEEFVAKKLGVSKRLATDMLELARDAQSKLDYDSRAALFALAFRSPLSALVPERVRRSAIDDLVAPMLATPAARRVYAQGRGDPAATACAGLVREA